MHFGTLSFQQYRNDKEQIRAFLPIWVLSVAHLEDFPSLEESSIFIVLLRKQEMESNFTAFLFENQAVTGTGWTRRRRCALPVSFPLPVSARVLDETPLSAAERQTRRHALRLHFTLFIILSARSRTSTCASVTYRATYIHEETVRSLCKCGTGVRLRVPSAASRFCASFHFKKALKKKKGNGYETILRSAPVIRSCARDSDYSLDLTGKSFWKLYVRYSPRY